RFPNEGTAKVRLRCVDGSDLQRGYVHAAELHASVMTYKVFESGVRRSYSAWVTATTLVMPSPCTAVSARAPCAAVANASTSSAAAVPRVGAPDRSEYAPVVATAARLDASAFSDASSSIAA